MPATTRTAGIEGPSGPGKYELALPLEFTRSQVIPPSPNRLRSAIDWLPEYAGFSWLAYGASSFVVVSHFPSPLSPDESASGPFFRQVLDPYPDASHGDANAVAWCPTRPSQGLLSVGIGSFVSVYSPREADGSGSLQWRKIASLEHSFIVVAIEWTGSGDGIVIVGCEVVLWKRIGTSWEIYYQLKTEVPQAILSSTWSIHGPVATASAYSAHPHVTTDGVFCSFESNRHVLVCQDGGKSGFFTVDIYHPHSVTAIQWRPSSSTWLKKDRLYPRRDVLLTCCLDGAVRLWSEIDGDKARKQSKDASGQKSTRPSYHVIAVIEVNHSIRTTLGVDTFVSWGADINYAISVNGGDNSLTAENCNCNLVGSCDWVVVVGPEPSVALWAIHLLDDVFPLRSPRVSLWNKCDLKDLHMSQLCTFESSNSNDQLILINAVVSRNTSYGPPDTCSLLWLSQNKIVSWLHLRNPEQTNVECEYLGFPQKEEALSCSFLGNQNLDGHEGSILQIAMHPSFFEGEIIASLDSQGILLFWSVCISFPCAAALEAAHIPSWQLLGRFSLRGLSSTLGYIDLAWVPFISHGDRFLLIGHTKGIDCFVITISDTESKKLLCNRILTISFSGLDIGNGPYQMFAIPTAPSSTLSSAFSNFRIIVIWMKEFQTLVWELGIKSKDTSNGICNSYSDEVQPDFFSPHTFEYFHVDRTYHITTVLFKSKFPSLLEKITSFAVTPCENSIMSVPLLTFSKDLCRKSPCYHVATGYSNGNIRLWRMKTDQPDDHFGRKSMSWEMVGMHAAHQGSVDMISLTNSGTNIASVCTSDRSSTPLHIWGLMPFVGGGCFSLEHRLPLDGQVVALRWLEPGNGQMLLGLCTQKELRVYSQTRCTPMVLVEESYPTTPIWSCIAVCCTSSTVKGFLWSLKLTPVLFHESHFSLFSHWLFRSGRVKKEFSPNYAEGYLSSSNGDQDENSRQCVSTYFGFQQPVSSVHGPGLYNILSACDMLAGSLPAYHPEALILYLYSGKWKCAHKALQHLVNVLLSSNKSPSATRESCPEESSHIFIPEISLSEYFESPTDTNSRKLNWNYDILTNISDQRSMDFVLEGSVPGISGSKPCSSSEISNLNSIKVTLESFERITSLNDLERIRMLAIVDFLVELDSQQHFSAYQSFDKPSRRFWVAVRLKYLYSVRKIGRPPTKAEIVADSWMIAWASQSDSQESLFNSIISSEPTWDEMRNMGVGYWFTDATLLRNKIEKLARSQYLLKKDPKDCALLYLALNRIQVLVGLFKLSKDEKDKPLVGFLSRNFQEEKNKAAALKNAYVLLGRHQFELAVAFFLLGQDPSSAIMACAKNLGDEQLALTICYLAEGSGGPLERQLISNVLIPNALGKGDHWLVSLLEWRLGNYSASFKSIAGSCSGLGTSGVSHTLRAYLDPNIGQYCALLASKNRMRNSVGDDMASILSKWATYVTASALNRCGFPIEALECMSSLNNREEAKDRKLHVNSPNSESLVLHGILTPCSLEGCNWLMDDISTDLEYYYFLNTAMRYISTLLLEYPGWRNDGSMSPAMLQRKLLVHEDEKHIEILNAKVCAAISILERNYFLRPEDVIIQIIISSKSKGLVFLGHTLFHAYDSHRFVDSGNHKANIFLPGQVLPRLLLESIKETCFILQHYILYCSFMNSVFGISINVNGCSQHYSWAISINSFICSMWNLRIYLKLHGSKMLSRDILLQTFTVLDHFELIISFALAWCEKRPRTLMLVINAILNDLNKKVPFNEAIGGSITDFICRTLALADENVVDRNLFVVDGNYIQQNECSSLMLHFLNEKWLFIGVSFWTLLTDFSKSQLDMLISKRVDFTGTALLPETVPVCFANILTISLSYTSSMLRRYLLSLLLEKVDHGFPMSTFLSLEESNKGEHDELHFSLKKMTNSSMKSNSEDQVSVLRSLMDISRTADLYGNAFKEKIKYLPSEKQRPSWCQHNIQNATEFQAGKNVNTHLDIHMLGSSSDSGSTLLQRGHLDDNERIYGRNGKDINESKETICFLTPKDVHKRNGELIEAMCSNSINEHDVVLASNRKGLIFCNWDSRRPKCQQTEYIWRLVDWPHDRWIEESIPVDSSASSVSRLGGTGRAIAADSFVRPGRDLTGGGAFGIPGYAGMGASGIGWSLQEGLEDLIDPPATVDNISTRALSSHPSKPFFLVGSNTRAYLWEFGKEKATATYGTSSAASLPRQLALISTLKFDSFGHRFTSGAMDGLVCAWQLDDCGIGNVKPTESAVCFSNYVCDVTYMGSSGSIIASAGLSTSGANIVIWDTLAPHTSSQASIFCHEGGARSLSVFSNGVGCGSTSPIIVTGGKSGDVGLHDFRYIATGRIKRHRHSQEQSLNSPIPETHATENLNGMLWYIEKAHIGSVATISTIPNTSLFLTGGKDGDVKLWDAKSAQLVFHWPKLHDKHTFFQSGSRGIGGVVRAAVTDIQVLSGGFLTCGGDGAVKLIQLQDSSCWI